MEYRLFVVEDDPVLAKGIEALAAAWGMNVGLCQDFRHVAEEAVAFAPHIVVLDIRLPCFDGFYWCRELRRVSTVPIVFLSSAADNMNIVMAMNLGADDFIAKPFDGSVLMAKLQALLRRSYDFAETAPVLSHRGAFLNTGSGELCYEGQSISLSKNEYRIMLCLMQSKGQPVSREKLMQRLWESDSFVDENTLSVNVNRLRKKLDAVGLTGFITTRVGIGYQVG